MTKAEIGRSISLALFRDSEALRKGALALIVPLIGAFARPIGAREPAERRSARRDQAPLSVGNLMQHFTEQSY
jgi:hypothetical protein